MDTKENKELSAALKRRKDRYARQAQQQELLNNTSAYKGIFEKLNGDYQVNGSNEANYGNINGTYTNGNGVLNSSKKFSNGNSITNGFTNHNCNGHQDDENVYLNRITKTTSLRDVLLNGL